MRNLPQLRARSLAVGLGLAAVVVWAYWPTLTDIVHKWSTDPLYSHGFLVPIFSLFYLYSHRGQLGVGRIGYSWQGAVLVLGGVLLRLAGAYFYVNSAERYSLLLVLAGVALGLGGWAFLRWAGPAIAFLLFMIPLPPAVEGFLAYPLQRAATLASTYCLQTCGVLAESEGTVVQLSDSELGVVEACSGLRMLVVFFALSTALVLSTSRPVRSRIILLFSALPIALFCNVVRITATGLLYEWSGPRAAHLVLHDLAGWFMILLASGLLLLELWVLSRLFVLTPPGNASTPYFPHAQTRKRSERSTARALVGPKRLAP
jgi:exosortase